MSRLLCSVALLSLAACGSEQAENRIAEGGQPAAAVAPATDAAEAEKMSQEQARAREFAWIGRFAASPELCEGGVWDIGERRIVTDGETACDVNRIGRGPGQVTLELACTAEGMLSRERWTLTPRSEDGLGVSRVTETETIDVDLIRCG